MTNPWLCLYRSPDATGPHPAHTYRSDPICSICDHWVIQEALARIDAAHCHGILAQVASADQENPIGSAR